MHSKSEIHLEKKNGADKCYVYCCGNHRFKSKTLIDEFWSNICINYSSFCNATCAELGFRCGIECGSVTAGLIGQFKWHYDVIGATVEEAIKIESSVSDW